jgi:hypothetical protein
VISADAYSIGIPLNAISADRHPDPPRRVLLELNSQLQNWRSVLPPELQWSEHRRNELSDSTQLHRSIASTFNSDIMIAQLRARFYNARFTLLGPFLYMALHHPELLSTDDTQHCVSALRSTMLWPLSAASVSEQKRLIPHLFTWTHNAMSFLCIFSMIGHNEVLRKICEQDLDLRELRISVAIQLSWLQDMKAIDNIAEWAWRLLHPLFIRKAEVLEAQ